MTVSGHKLDYPAPSYSTSHTLMGYSPLGLSQPVASPHLPSSFPSPQPPGGGPGGQQQQQGGSVVTKQEQFPNSGSYYPYPYYYPYTYHYPYPYYSPTPTTTPTP